MADAKPNQPSCQQLINSFNEPFVIIDRDYRIIAANYRYAAHYGCTTESVVGRRCHEVSHHLATPCSEHGEHCPLEEMFRTEDVTQVIHVHYDADGHEERVQITATPLFDDEGAVQYMGERITPAMAEQSDAWILGPSATMLALAAQLRLVANTRTTVLLLGESGTGKECLAKYIHHHSGRAANPFVVVDCATLSDRLTESELFGQEANAFPGADKRKAGFFEQADGGTLFIDEVGELSLDLQRKLLRVLETGAIRPVGAADYTRLDVRVIVASHRDLNAMVAAGGFRKDLYYRLSAFPVQIPPLRDRREDVLKLAEHFLRRLGDAEAQLPLEGGVIAQLLAYDYPGNVRELRNLLERAAIYAAGGPLDVRHLVFDGELYDPAQEIPAEDLGNARPEDIPALINRRGRRPSKQTVLNVLAECGGHRSEAAQRLGISERTLYRLLTQLREEI